LIPFTRQASKQVADLTTYYEDHGRLDAALNLLAALSHADTRLSRDAQSGLPAPRPYPKLARTGRLWIKEAPNWIAYRLSPLTILGVFHERADIPKRVDR
jgi:plasmid stabilization system protein ParE